MPQRCLAPLAALLMGGPVAAQPRLDVLGDPLPPGAVARLGTTRLTSADGNIVAAAFTADGKTVLATSDRWCTRVRRWDAATGAERPPLVATGGATFDLASIAVSPDGRFVACHSFAKVHLWDAATGKLAAEFTGLGDAGLAFLDGGKTLAGASMDGTIVWWDAATRKETARWRPWAHLDEVLPGGGKRVRGFAHAAFAADGRSLAVQEVELTSGDGHAGVRWKNTVAVLDLAERKERWRSQCHGNHALLTFAPDGRRLALRRDAGVAELRDVASGQQLAAVAVRTASDEEDGISALAFAPDGGTVALAQAGGPVTLWSLDATVAPRRLLVRGVGPAARCLAYSPDGKVLLAATHSGLQLFDAASGAALLPRAGHRSGVRALWFSADGRRLSSTAGWDPYEVLTWDTATWNEVGRSCRAAFTLKGIRRLSPDHATAAVPAGNEAWAFHDPVTGRRLGEVGAGLQFGDYPGYFLPGGRIYATRYIDADSGDPWGYFSVPSGKLLLRVPPQALWEKAFTLDGHRAAVALRDGTVRVVDVSTGKDLWQLGEKEQLPLGESLGAALAFSVDGKYFAAWDDRRHDVRVWDLATGKTVLHLRSETPERWVQLAWSPDGRTLAVSGLDGRTTIRLWEISTGKLRREFPGHDEDVRVQALAFSPDGRLLASGSADTTVLVWDVYATMP